VRGVAKPVLTVQGVYVTASKPAAANQEKDRVGETPLQQRYFLRQIGY
jgi:hypothetical protein